jgi:hypothetical protein
MIQIDDSAGNLNIIVSDADYDVIIKEGVTEFAQHITDLLSRYKQSQLLAEQQQYAEKVMQLSSEDQAAIKQMIDSMLAGQI